MVSWERERREGSGRREGGEGREGRAGEEEGGGGGSGGCGRLGKLTWRRFRPPQALDLPQGVPEISVGSEGEDVHGRNSPNTLHFCFSVDRSRAARCPRIPGP